MEAIYEPFFALPGAKVFFLGVWALVMVVSIPFCWGWDAQATWPEDGGAPKFDPSPAMVAIAFPFWPLAALTAPIAIVILALVIAGPYYVRRWWNADWSRP